MTRDCPLKPGLFFEKGTLGSALLTDIQKGRVVRRGLFGSRRREVVLATDAPARHCGETMTTLALVRQVSSTFSRALRKELQGPTPDVGLAREQHARYCDALSAIGLDVEVLPPLDACPDACFVEDRVVSLAGRALLTNSSVSARRGEAETLYRHLSSRMDCRWMDPGEDAFIDGGDVIVLDSVMLVGLSERTNQAGIEVLRAWTRGLPIEIKVLPVDSELHLKCSASALDPRTLLCVEGWAHGDELPRGTKTICVPPQEAYAANALAYEGAVVIAEGYPFTAAAIAATGRRVVTVDVSEIRRADGSLTCLSVLTDPLR